MRKWSLSSCILAGVLAFAGCQPADEPVDQERVAEPAPEPGAPLTQPAEEPAIAAAQLSGPEGVSGVVTFTEQPGGVQLVARVEGAPPGTHGIHLHETGVCEPPSFESAGGHFAPTGAPHGGPDSPQHHAGDFGNIEIAEDGTGHLDLTSQMLSVEPGPRSVLGKAVVLHAQADDLTTQPTGASGARIACGVVEQVEGNVEPMNGGPAPAAGEAI